MEEYQSHLSNDQMEVCMSIGMAQEFINSLSSEVDRNIEMIETLERYIDFKVSRERY